MNKKILVIFFITIISTNLIYKHFNNSNKNILIITDNDKINTITNNYIELLKEKYTVNQYKYESIDYKELIKKIKTNDYYISKKQNVYINQLIHNADYIIINVNNQKYKSKCKKSKIIQQTYIDTIYNNTETLKKLISSITNAKIIIMGNYCIQTNDNKDYLEKKYQNEEYINISKMKIKFKEIDHQYIYNELIKKLN